MNIVIPALFAAGTVLTIILLASRTARKKRSANTSGKDTVLSSLNDCTAAVKKYLRENKTTAFFQQKLNTVIDRLITFSLRCDNIKNVLIERFGVTGLSYGKFAAPVAALQEYLVKLINSLVARMQMFDEVEYRRRIGEFSMTNRTKEAESYKAIEQEYKDFTEQAIMALDDAILKLDQLLLELSKLGEAELDKAAHIMEDLDDTIKQTQLYK